MRDENYACGSARNFTQYCNKLLQPLFDQQSMETDPVKRRARCGRSTGGCRRNLARPILYHNKVATCWHPWLHGITPMVNSVYTGHRFENVWLDR
jgi:peptide/nickel transport system substrate-binding protein